MFRKIVAVWVSLAMLFGFMVIVDVVTDITIPVKAITITVDDSGGAMYTKIQDAINASNDGDTVFVYNGTYYENVVVDKTINLTGEDINNTIIDGGGVNNVIRITVNWVNITSFTTTNSGSNFPWIDSGILLETVQNCKIIHSIVINNLYGIALTSSNNNSVANNIIVNNNFAGIFLYNSSSNTIINNNVSLNPKDGIQLLSSYGNNIVKNNVSNNKAGIWLVESDKNNISYNNAHNNEYGISLSSSLGNNATGNNASYNRYGIQVLYSNQYNIWDNNASSNEEYGIYVYESDNINITRLLRFDT